jgi:hypothetical protein
MGLTFYKGINVGPFRFNLSGAGAGISTGVRGFRIGTGPRGTYISIGAGGFRYRQYLGDREKTRSSDTRDPISVRPHRPEYGDGERHLVAMTPITSAEAASLYDESSSQLLHDLNERNGRISFVAIVNVIAFLIAAGLAIAWCNFPESSTPKIAVALLVVSYCLGIVLAYFSDLERLQTVLMFDASEDFQVCYQQFLGVFQEASLVAQIQRLNAKGDIDIHDRKYHAGGTSQVDLQSTRIVVRLPSRVKANVVPPCLLAGRNELYFFPDRILVKTGDEYGAVSFANLKLRADTSKTIVSSAPSDGKVVGRTWRYVNKNGGPDRRFKNNSELPIVEFSTLTMQSSGGLNGLFYFSRPGTGELLKKSLEELNAKIGAITRQKAELSNLATSLRPQLDENLQDEPSGEEGSASKSIEAPVPTQSSIGGNPSIASEQFYLGLGDKNFGLYERNTIEEWIRTNQLQPGTLFWEEGSQKWLDISVFPSRAAEKPSAAA